MIYGVGVDIVKIDRIQSAVEKWGEGFLRKVFTENEIEYCYSKKVPYLSLAVRFAAKEAFIKAISGEITVSLKDVEVVTEGSGRPNIKVYGKVKEFIEDKNIRNIHLSLSHEKEFGVATAVLEARD
ncbi:MAG: holo-ACP synthase [Nitrospirota bacterium]|nr:MAG: holo-ACP synthase [Nitrospirota bacterium]